MKRRYLRPLKFGKRSKDFFVFDTETGKIKNGKIEYTLSARPESFIFGVVYGKNFRKIIHSVDEFKLEFKKRRYKNKIVYAHNAEYDLSCIYDNIYKLDPDAIFNGKFITCTNGNCKFADSFNLLPTSVKKLGELLGLQKLDLGKNLKSNFKNLNKDIEYCIRDCEIVYKSLEKIFEHAEPSFTIGSLSMKIFRANFLKQTIKVNEESDEFFNALYGGRTEAFILGKCNLNVYDINSAYPDAMQKLEFPNPARLRVVKNSDFNKYINDLNFEGMIEATVNIPESINIPMLPFRTKEKLLFPVGKIRGAWCLNEFRYAQSFGISVLKVHKLIVAEKLKSPFKQYIAHYYELRLNTRDEFEKYFYKLFMNNLYGKLIQRARFAWRFVESLAKMKEFMRERKIKSVELIEVVGGYFLKYDDFKIFSHTIACFGAYITASVRIKLHKKMMEYPREIGYCDTDSLAISKDIKMNDAFLGGWKKEDKIITNVRALKDYVYIENGTTKQNLKGVKRDAKQLDEFANVFKFKRMIKTRESFRRLDGLPPGTFVEQVKVLTGDYSKRELLPDGKTKPFKFIEVEESFNPKPK